MFFSKQFAVYGKHPIARTIESLWDLSALFDYFVTLNYEIVYQIISAVSIKPNQQTHAKNITFFSTESG